jgi:hypothetical protein
MQNVNMKEEAKKGLISHPQYNQHQKIIAQQSAEEVHTALKSCNELGNARTLEQFLIDLQKMQGVVPKAADVNWIKKDAKFKDFLNRVIVCTEPGYKDNLEEMVKEEPQYHYADKYMELISDVIKELLQEGQTNKLQTFGYSLDDD